MAESELGQSLAALGARDPRVMVGLLQFLDAQIAELVGLAFFAVVLDADDAACVHVVLDLRGDHAVDFDFDFVTHASDAVAVPFIALEGVAGAGLESGLAGGVALDRTCEPHAAALVVEPAGPAAFRVAIDLALVAENLVWRGMSAEHEATVCRAGREQHFSFKHEVRVGLLGDEEKLFVCG